MKLQELGLKSKPQTKYFDGGYVSFSTIDKVLWFKVTVLDKDRKPFLFSDDEVVRSKEHLKLLLSIKHRDEVIQA